MDIWVNHPSVQLGLTSTDVIPRNAIYAVMIMSLTIGMSLLHMTSLIILGFGDFTPETPAGRVVFIVYALMAVPIVTSFAVQTITGLVGGTPYRTFQARLTNIE